MRHIRASQRLVGFSPVCRFKNGLPREGHWMFAKPCTVRSPLLAFGKCTVAVFWKDPNDIEKNPIWSCFSFHENNKFLEIAFEVCGIRPSNWRCFCYAFHVYSKSDTELIAITASSQTSTIVLVSSTCVSATSFSIHCEGLFINEKGFCVARAEAGSSKKSLNIVQWEDCHDANAWMMLVMMVLVLTVAYFCTVSYVYVNMYKNHDTDGICWHWHDDDDDDDDDVDPSIGNKYFDERLTCLSHVESDWISLKLVNTGLLVSWFLILCWLTAFWYLTGIKTAFSVCSNTERTIRTRNL